MRVRKVASDKEKSMLEYVAPQKSEETHIALVLPVWCETCIRIEITGNLPTAYLLTHKHSDQLSSNL